MVGLIDVKWKGGASAGHWVNYVTLTFHLTHDLDLWFFKVKFENFGCVFFKVKHSIGHISVMVGPIDVKWKGGTSVEYWVNLAWRQTPETGSGDVAFTDWVAQVKMQKYIFGTHFATCNNIHSLPGV